MSFARASRVVSFFFLFTLLFAGCQSPGQGRARVDFPSLPVPCVKQSDQYACGAASLSAVLTYLGVASDERTLHAELGPIPEEGYSMGALRDWARAKGCSAFVVQGSLEFLEQQLARGRPVIIAVRQSNTFNHMLVVTGLSHAAGYLAVMDPAQGAIAPITMGYLTRHWIPLGAPALLVARTNTAPSISSSHREVSVRLARRSP